jgi:hypothetical protein
MAKNSHYSHAHFNLTHVTILTDFLSRNGNNRSVGAGGRV